VPSSNSGILQSVVVYCRVLQCVAVCCDQLWYRYVELTWQCAAVCYRVLQCVAVCYSLLQCIVTNHDTAASTSLSSFTIASCQARVWETDWAHVSVHIDIYTDTDTDTDIDIDTDNDTDTDTRHRRWHGHRYRHNGRRRCTHRRRHIHWHRRRNRHRYVSVCVYLLSTKNVCVQKTTASWLVTTYCSTLQHTATHSTHNNTQQHNTLQHTATHSATNWSTLQHTATKV